MAGIGWARTDEETCECAACREVAEESVTVKPILFSGEMVRAILEGRKTQSRRVLQFPRFAERFDWRHDNVASIHPDGSGTGWIAWSPDSVTAEFTKTAYPGAQGFKCPYGLPGDRLWVRETFALQCDVDGDEPPFPDGRPIKRGFIEDEIEHWLQPHYKATDPTPALDCEHEKCDGDICLRPWQPSIHMPRWASRITLELTKVRVERVQEISEEDAIAEGLIGHLATCNSGLAKYPDGVPSGINADRNCDCKVRQYSILWDSINAKRGFGWDVNPWTWVLEFKKVTEAA